MYVKFDVPEVTAYPGGFPGYWLKITMIGSVSSSYQVNALASTYVRLVEASLVEYRLPGRLIVMMVDATCSAASAPLENQAKACGQSMPALQCFNRCLAIPLRLSARGDLTWSLCLNGLS